MNLFRNKAFLLAALSIVFSVVLLFAGLALGSYKLNAKASSADVKEAKQAAAKTLPVPAGDMLRTKTVYKICANETIPAYSYSEVCSMDMSKPSGVTVEDLKLVTKSGLVGLEEKLYQMEQDYNLNCLFLLGIASHESAYGTSQFHPNNICGYGYSGFSSKEECLDTVGRALAKYYLTPGGAHYKGTTIDDVNRTYAADPAWDSKVANKVTYFYQVISESHNARLEKLK
ncbi:MAG: hypothetical protein Q4A65_02280 [Bacillota bacterium]|nr:hypothetical protein [Bacillota bacterium]